MTKKDLTQKIVEYFEVNIFKNHIDASLKIHSKFKSYNINPIVVKYLSKILENDFNANGVAKSISLN